MPGSKKMCSIRWAPVMWNKFVKTPPHVLDCTLSLFIILGCILSWGAAQLSGLVVNEIFPCSSALEPSPSRSPPPPAQCFRVLYLWATEVLRLSQCSTEPHDGKSLLFPSRLFNVRSGVASKVWEMWANSNICIVFWPLRLPQKPEPELGGQ